MMKKSSRTASIKGTVKVFNKFKCFVIHHHLVTKRLKLNVDIIGIIL